MGKDGGTLKIQSTIRLAPIWTLRLSLFSYFFQVLYNPHHFSMVPRALFQAPYVYSIVDPLKGPYTKAKTRRRRAAECPKDLQDHLFLFRTRIQLSLVLGM